MPKTKTKAAPTPRPLKEGVPIFNLFDDEFWGNKQRRLAHKEGWDIFDNDSTGVLEIQRLDDADNFENDGAAAHHVKVKAVSGSVLHLQALVALASAIVVPICLQSLDSAEDLVDLIKDTRSKGDGENVHWALDPAAAGTLLRTNY